MTTVFNTPNWAFLVQVSTPKGAHVQYQYIEQLVTHPTHRHRVQAVQNQVQERLNALHRRTGLIYHVIGEGSPETVKGMIARSNIEIA